MKRKKKTERDPSLPKIRHTGTTKSITLQPVVEDEVGCSAEKFGNHCAKVFPPWKWFSNDAIWHQNSFVWLMVDSCVN